MTTKGSAFTEEQKRPTTKEANESDAVAVKNIINSVASEKYYIAPESSGDWNETIREIKNRKGLIIVAQVDDKIVGMAYLARGKSKKKHVAFSGITILKEFRRVGNGNP